MKSKDEVIYDTLRTLVDVVEQLTEDVLGRPDGAWAEEALRDLRERRIELVETFTLGVEI